MGTSPLYLKGEVMSLLKKGVRVFERIEGYFAFFAVILIIAMMLMVLIDVVGRYFFNQPLRGANELCGNSLVWFTFLSAAWILKREKHVMVTIVVDSLRPRARSLLGIFASILGIIVCLSIVVFGSRLVWQTFQSGTVQPFVLALPLAPLYTIIPIGSAFLMIRFIIRTYRYLVEWRALAEKEEKPFEGLSEI